MSSNDHKTFKTDATQKTSTDTEIVSDAIILPPYSTDHILVVTAPDIVGETTTEIPTQTIDVPAKNNMFYYGTGNSGGQYKAFWETTDNVFDSYDFSSGLSWFYAGSQSYYWYIDRVEVLKLEFTDGSYISLSSAFTHLTLTYRDGSNGTVKYFSTEFESTLQFLHSSQASDVFDRNGGNGYESASNQADTYIKKASYIGPNGYKVTASGAYSTQSQSINNLLVSANDGADWAELDFSSKTISKTTLLAPVGWDVAVFRPDILSFASKEITFDSLLVKYDDSGNEITNGTFAIFDAFSKDYDRFFLFGNGAYDSIPITNTINWSDISNIVVKSHDGTVNLDFKAISYATDPVTELTTYYYIYKERTDLPNYINSEGTTEREVLIEVSVIQDQSISGVIDVELEMSPDGENWCAAVTSEYIASEGGGAAVDGAAAEDANLKAISTIPDSQHTVGQYKNKFALGALSADDNGVETTDAGAYNSYTRDFMHKFISKDKPFNYSLWLKTNTEQQAFGDDYTPVLFRHGGKDKFTNSNVVQLTDSVTQNLSLPLFNKDKALFSTGSRSLTRVDLEASSGTHINPFKLPTDTDPNYLPNIEEQDSITVSFQIKVTPVVNGSPTIFRLTLDNGNALIIRYLSSLNAIGISYLFYYPTDGNYYETASYYRPIGTVGNWSHVTCRFCVSNTTTSHHYYTRLGINGNDVNFSLKSTGIGQSNIDINYINNTTFCQSPINSVYIFGDSTTYTGDVLIDNLRFGVGSVYDGSSNRWDIIYNSRKVPEETPLAASNYTTCVFKMGDGPGDSISPLVIKDAFAPSSNRQLVLASGSTGTSITTLGTTEDPVVLGEGDFNGFFDTASNISISGWFKTTLDATGTLFSNTGGAVTSGMKLDVNASDMILSFLDAPDSITINADVNDGNWHHILITKNDSGTNQFTVYIDGSQIVQSTKSITNADLRGTNAFTLLGDGQNNATAASPAATDISKLNASLSNWSLHSEVLDQYAAKQLYSNGHVRNLKNLPNISASNIVAWWQLNDSANPEQDLSENGYDLSLQDGSSLPLTDYVVGLTDGAPLIAEEDQYGSGITMSLTKRFDVINNEWTNVHTHPTCICLSFNGFEDQAEYFAIYTSNTIDVANNEWHNLILSFSGKEGSSTANTVYFCFDSATHNFVLIIDGSPIYTAHFVGGLGGPITNKCFPAEERHLKFVTNDQEDYMPHAQLNSNIFESINQTDQKFEPVVAKNYKTSFIGYADESSFHSESWFVNAAGVPTTQFNDQKPATMYGNTSTLSNRGVNSTVYGQGKPYPLSRPSVIGVDPSTTGNQYIDPNKYDVSTNPDGGLEAWWRWGDTDGDCSVNINDNIGFSSTPISPARSLIANNYVADINQTTQIPEDLFFLTESDSIYVPEGTTSTGGGNTLAYIPVIIEAIQAGVCNLKNLTSPLLQYIRVKFTNSGEAQLGKDKVEASIHYRKRR